MQKNLSQFSNIVSGYTFRGPVKSQQNGDIYVLQAKNIAIDEDITSIAGFTVIDSKSLRNPYFLEYNDVLIVSRGSGLGSFRSAVFTSKESKVMPSSSVHVIRVRDVNVLPKYVSLYLNSDVGQKELLQIVTGGSYIQSILLKNLNELKIPIPPLHTQKSIVALRENITNQEQILKRKQELQKNIINATFNNLINN